MLERDLIHEVLLDTDNAEMENVVDRSTRVSSEYTCVQRPIRVSTAITHTSWYRLMRRPDQREVQSRDKDRGERERKGEREGGLRRERRGREREPG